MNIRDLAIFTDSAALYGVIVYVPTGTSISPTLPMWNLMLENEFTEDQFGVIVPRFIEPDMRLAALAQYVYEHGGQDWPDVGAVLARVDFVSQVDNFLVYERDHLVELYGKYAATGWAGEDVFYEWLRRVSSQ